MCGFGVAKLYCSLELMHLLHRLLRVLGCRLLQLNSKRL